jgi:hypothetical protein
MKKRILLMSILIVALLIFGKCTGQFIENQKGNSVKNSEQSGIPNIQKAIKTALQAAKETVLPLIDTKFHNNGKTIIVPDDYSSIQAAIDVADKGDIVSVKAGTYYELITMKDGVKLVSDASEGGNKLVSIDGAWLKLPKRTFRTIIDGSKSEKSKHGMFDFNPGIGRNSIIDGFTIQNLPKQNHHIPGHAHGLNVRGASPVITNCLIQEMGSTGIGMHVIFKDQGEPMDIRDFREANIIHQASPVIYNNIIRDNYGLGIGSNHFSKAYILGNEVINNDDSEINGTPSPAIGNKHGSAATIIGNIVHENPGGGILAGKGEPQGKILIDKATHPKIIRNVIYSNGNIRPPLSCNQAGTIETPVEIIGNAIYNTETVGISLSNTSVGIVEENSVSGNNGSGIVIMNSTVLQLNTNTISDKLKENTPREISKNTVGDGDFKTMQERMIQKLSRKINQFQGDTDMQSFLQHKRECAKKATNIEELEVCKKMSNPRQQYMKQPNHPH